MKKSLLVLKDSKTIIKANKEHMEIKSFTNSYIVAYRHIEKIFLNKNIHIDIATCYAISQKVPFYLIDEDGYILSRLVEVSDEEI